MKKVSGLPTWTAVNINGKRGLGGMTDADEQNSRVDPAEPPRKIIRSLPRVDPTVVVETQSQLAAYREAQSAQ